MTRPAFLLPLLAALVALAVACSSNGGGSTVTLSNGADGGAALHSELENQPVKVTMARILGGLAPTASIASGLDVTKLSHDPEIEKVYRSDPLVHHQVSLGFGKIMLDVNRWTLEHAAEFPVPLLLSHGAEDAVAFPSSSREVAAAAGDKATLLIWEGMYHETHNEVAKADVLKALIQWMDARLKSR